MTRRRKYICGESHAGLSHGCLLNGSRVNDVEAAFTVRPAVTIAKRQGC